MTIFNYLHSNYYTFRDAGDGLFVVEFDVKMHTDVFKKAEAIFYKYVVFSCRMQEVGHPYEYLHRVPAGGSHTNRALKVPNNKRAPGGRISVHYNVLLMCVVVFM